MKGISVIIPVYNREAFLEQAIRSVLAQDYAGKLEIIVSDDGSTDRSVEIAGSFGEKVQVVQKPNGIMARGVSATRNRGLAASTQAYVSFLDSDDFYLPNHLNRMAAILENRAELGFVFSRMMQMKDQNGDRFIAPWTRTRLSKRDIMNPVVSGANVFHTNIFLFRKRVFDTVGVFDESYTNGEDGDLWIRISEQYNGTFSDHYGAVYRSVHQFSQLTEMKRGHINQCSQRIFSNALARCLSKPRANRYRLFRLRLILSFYTKPHWCGLLSVVFRHPLLACATALSPSRIKDRYTALEWKKLQDHELRY